MRKLSVFLVLFATLGPIPAIEAQGIGGFIKKKVEEKTKPKEAVPESKLQGTSTIGYELTAAVMEAFHRGIEVELGRHQEYRKRLAALKTQEEYEECGKTAAAGTEGEKLNKEYGVRMQKVNTSEEMNTLIGWLVKERQALTLRTCGEDPRDSRSQQVQIFRSAEMAGAIEFGKAFPRPQAPSDADQAGETDNLDAWSDWCAEGEDAGFSEAQPWVGGCGGERAVLGSPVTDPMQGPGTDPFHVFCDSDQATQDAMADGSGGAIVLPQFGMHRITYSKAAAEFYRQSCKNDRRRYQIQKEWTAAFCRLPRWKQDDLAKNDRDVSPGRYHYTPEEAQTLRQYCNNPVLKAFTDLMDMIVSP